jgi:hypothetical protein
MLEVGNEARASMTAQQLAAVRAMYTNEQLTALVQSAVTQHNMQVVIPKPSNPNGLRPREELACDRCQKDSRKRRVAGVSAAWLHRLTLGFHESRMVGGQQQLLACHC